MANRGRRNYYETAVGVMVAEALRLRQRRRKGESGPVSYARIAEEANEIGLKAPAGGMWRAAMVRYALVGRHERPVRKGEETMGEEKILMPAEVERCLDRLNGQDWMIFVLAIASGLRNAELCGLERRDLVLSDGRQTVKVRRENAKGKRPRSVVVSKWVSDKLRGYVADRPRLSQKMAPVFVSRNGKRLTRRSLAREMCRIRKRCGLQDEFTAHTLRHTFASVLYFYVRNTNTVRLVLGHRSILTTQIYEHGLYDVKKGEMKVFHKFFTASERMLWRD